MTAKRFTMIYFETDGNLIFDETKHNGEWYNSAECLQDNEIVELLNELHEENRSLKFQLDECQNHKLFSRRELEKENEQLRHDATILIQSNQDYRKENEQLKEQLRDCEKFRHTVFQEISKEMNKHD